MIEPVKVTDKAIEEVKHIMANKNIPEDYGLRIGVKGGGCGGMGHVIGFDKKKDGDTEYQIDSVPIYVEKKHTMYLLGLVIDFHEDEESRGFVFLNEEDLKENTDSSNTESINSN
ncbi:MAG: iron-sulfur cluster assembly accessory protein [Cyclobacteriaceae bacterium]|nr:iron-sulfur cluster assembly accessory protein [Cyclobacteriaceae bacterium]MCH8516572.1 iron-sulfur cluster assembly accessory protein [Cyclobacteriaceae bacterium]